MSFNDSFIEEIPPGNINGPTFNWTNYSSFGLMLGITMTIGIYFGFFAKKQETTTDYLLGGKTMSYFPVAMSIISNHVSGVTLLGVPSEVYRFGTQFSGSMLTTIITCLMAIFIYLPVFHKLQLTSTFEYLEVRFARSVRQIASMVYTVSLILLIPVIIYGPALAVAHVSGFSVHYITSMISVVCIFYTSVGGLKALVWSDTIQFTVTIFTLSVVLVLGIISVGGFSEIWQISEKGGRLIFFNMDPSPFVRSTFWGVVFGLPIAWTSAIGINQGCVQRLLAVPKLSDARKSLWITCITLMTMKVISIYSGVIIYAKYHDCDPISTNEVKRPDQILPYYMMDVAGNIPGLPGLFIAALVSSALSTMSSALNTVAGTMWEDFISPWIPESDTKQKTATNVMKVTVVVLGCLCLALIFVVEQMGEIFTMATSMQGMTAGTIVGLFTLGMLVPWATDKGAVIGGILAFVTSAWIIMGAQYHRIKGHIRDEPLPSSTENCPYPLNMTHWTKPTPAPILPEDQPMILFTISFLYYAWIGFGIVMVFGTIVSFMTGSSDLSRLNRDHFSPMVQRFLPRTEYVKVHLAAMTTEPSYLNTENNSKE